MNLPAIQTISWPVGLVSLYHRRRILCSFAMSAALHLTVLAVLFQLRDGEFRPAEFGMEERPTTLSVTWIETVAPLPAEALPSPPPPAPAVEVPPPPAPKEPEPQPEPVTPAEPAKTVPETTPAAAPVVESPAPAPPTPSSIPAPSESPAPVATAPAAVDTASSAGPVIEAKPDHLRNPPPNYPRLARDRGWQGTTRLRIEVLATGIAGHIQIVNSSGYRILDEASVETVRQHWKFLPARRGDEAVDSWVEQDIVFQLRRG